MVTENPINIRGRRSGLDTAFRRWRDAKGLTLRQLAEKLGESEPLLAPDFGSVQYVEQNGTFDVRWIRGLAAVLNIPEDEIETETKRLRNM